MSTTVTWEIPLLTFMSEHISVIHSKEIIGTLFVHYIFLAVISGIHS